MVSSHPAFTMCRRCSSRNAVACPKPLQAEIGSLAEGSRRLRRDHELAFYGAEDLTPSGFYTKHDADEAMGIARRTVSLVRPHV